MSMKLNVNPIRQLVLSNKKKRLDTWIFGLNLAASVESNLFFLFLMILTDDIVFIIFIFGLISFY